MRVNDASGASALNFPLLGAWFGLDLWTQWIGVDLCGPLGHTTSAGLRVTIQERRERRLAVPSRRTAGRRARRDVICHSLGARWLVAR